MVSVIADSHLLNQIGAQAERIIQIIHHLKKIKVSDMTAC